MYVDIDAVDNRRQRIASPKFLNNDEAPSRARHEIRAGDVIFSLVRPYLKNIAIVPPELDRQVASSAFCILRPGERVIPKYLFRVVSADSFIAAVPTYGHSPPAGRDEELLGLRIPLPPIDEQQRIVRVLDERLALLSAAETSLGLARARLDVYERRLLQATLGSHNGDQLWPTLPLGEFATIGTGSTPLRRRADYWIDGSVPWVTSGQLNEEWVRTPTALVTDAAVAATRLKVWPRHTLLVAMYGEGRTRGKCSELLIESTINQACAAIVLKPEAAVRRAFLKLFLRSRYESHRKMASGGVQPNLNLAIVRRWLIPVPPLDEQDEIVQSMAAASSVVAEVERACEASLIRAERLRNWVVSSEIPSSMMN